jgi:sugar phosphate isomerase/epimerase
MAVNLALTPDIRRSLDLEGQVDAARGAGFTSLGIFADRAGEDARTTFGSAGMQCHEVLALVITDNEVATLASAERLAAAAETMAAPWVSTIFHSPLTASTPRLIARCAAAIAQAGAGMAIEFHPFGPVTSIGAGLEAVERAGNGAGLLVDTWHFFVGDSTWSDLETLPVDRIAFVQFDDAPVPASEDLMGETMDRRVMPGEGTFDLDRFASTLLERGFDGTVSVEVLSRELLAVSMPEFARRAYAATARYWR